LGAGMSNTYFKGIVNAKARYEIPSTNAKSLSIPKLVEKFIFFCGKVTHFSLERSYKLLKTDYKLSFWEKYFLHLNRIKLKK